MATRRTRRGARARAEREFVSEAEEILECMRAVLADLGDQGAAGPEADPELVNALFRSAHSLKGLAGLFGFDPIRDLAHRLEDVLDDLRLSRIAADAGALALIDRAVVLFAELLGRVGDADGLAAAGEDVTRLAEEIASARAARTDDAAGLGELDLDPALLRALTEYEEHRLHESVERGRHVLLVEATFDILSFEEGLSELTAAIRELGELISTLPAPGDGPDAQIRFSLLVGSDLPAEDFSSSLAFPASAVRCVRAGASDGGGAASRQPRAPAAASAAGASPAGSESLKSISETVRVDIRKLDELMNLVGELVIARSILGELVARAASGSAETALSGDLARVHKDLDRKIRELQAAVLDVRMVPLRQVFEKVSRVVRRLRVELGKDVRLELRGADTELDKLIVEELVDPLMHVVRNALDHAIEPPDERRAAGKPPEGCVRVEAYQRGNHVVVAVADDGRGIDTASLRERAEARGLLAPGEALSEREALDLVFAPGLTSRSEVSGTSGRGVGMDVVRTNLGVLGGVVDVDSVPGRGTTVSMTLPITLAIVQSLVVGCADQRFAIPLTAVQETLLLDPSELDSSEGREVLNLRGEALALRDLAGEFGLVSSRADGKRFAVVIGMGDARLGILVDRLEGQQDTVIKPIRGPWPSVRGIAGATELGDQRPVLVLDASALLGDAHGRREAA
jgi:two-component system chemotaxis sensor kinase CheA